jgi:hypothetical protein
MSGSIVESARVLGLTPVILATWEGGRDQKDRSSKPTQTNSSRDPILEKKPNTHKTKGLMEWLK